MECVKIHAKLDMLDIEKLLDINDSDIPRAKGKQSRLA